MIQILPSTNRSRNTNRLLGLGGWWLSSASLLATLLLAAATRSGLLSWVISAGMTAIVVGVASSLFLETTSRRLLAIIVGFILAAAPALLLATSLMTVFARMGLPFDLLTTRMVAVLGWWLALGALRPLVHHLGSPQMPAWFGALVLSPVAAIVGLCALTWTIGQSGARTAQHFSFLYRTEDNATWVSHAFALLRNGQLPSTVTDSEYYAYSPLSSVPGVLSDVALRGRPSLTASVYRAVDVTMANQLLCLLVAAALIGLTLLVALTRTPGQTRPPAVGVFLLSVVATGVGTSVLAGAPMLSAGHMSLAWANVGLVLMAVLTVFAVRARSWAEFLPPLICVCLAAYSTAGAWPFIVFTPVTFGVLLFALRRSGLRVAPARPIGDGARTTVLSAGLIASALFAATPQFVQTLSTVGVKKLAGAEGGITAIEPTIVLAITAVAIAAMFLAYRQEDTFPLIASLMFAAACTGAGLVFMSQIIPGNNPTYSLTKSLYVVVAVGVLTTVAVLAYGAHTRFRRLLVVGTLVASSMVTASPTFGAVLKWWGTMDDQSSAAATRFLELSARGTRSEHVVCQPSPYVGALDSYSCNRWMDALSRKQGSSDFRLNVLKEEGAARNTWAKAKADGYLRRATVEDANEVITGHCIPEAIAAEAASPSAPQLDVRATPPGRLNAASGVGVIDTVQQCSKGLAIIGWAPFTKPSESLRVWANGPVDVLSVYRNSRPEVVSATGNGALVSPGFIIFLKYQPKLPSHLCIATSDRPRRLIAGSNPSGCLGNG